MYEIIAFIFFSILTLGMFGITVFSKNILHSMSSLAGGMIFISGFFFLLDAEFLGVVQMLVYTGAVMALYAFTMMFFNSTEDVKENIKSQRLIYTLSVLSAVLIVFILIAPIYSQDASDMVFVNTFGTDLMRNYPSNSKAVGMVLFTHYLLPFELAAVMLLVAMIAAIVLVSKKMDVSESLNDDGFIVKEKLR